jgi:uncharacterized protein YndB with AHSA1/START domain
MKKVLYVIIGLVILVCLVGLLAPKDFAVEREVTINKPVDEVFAYLKQLKNQNEWSVWARMDPKMKTEFRGTDGTVGFVSAWEGNDDVGKGEQEIKNIVEGQRIDYELRFIKPWEATNKAYVTTESVGENQTKVKWGFSGHMSFPMNTMMLFMNMDKTVGKDFEQGLANLKANLEK